ncbi:alpha/beta hydrolase [Novosphingobium umbonatum]|uniref:Alpha/beta hydrolase n=1 Tax=Novosphingobium umbonatum TaxID=1908524 RepID=A0A3S2Y9R6_9SPHN|nr:alpha/beta hydrolase [Novosphingobium umbonatum]RVU05663.1 alpha/beta hydrolase [Novosphingobium umbonatum]
MVGIQKKAGLSGAILTLVCGAFLGGAAWAQTPTRSEGAADPIRRIAPLPEPNAIAIYPDAGQGKPAASGEIWTMSFDQPWVRNVTRPTLTPFMPAPDKANGTAILILPGGGFLFNSIDNEGWGAARALAAQGYTAFVLKYRTEPTSSDDHLFWQAFVTRLSVPAAGTPKPDSARRAMDLAREDGQAALRLIRARAAEWKIDPHRVGMMGFSAGAMTTLNTTLADAPDARPDFIAPIYGAMTNVTPPPHPQPMFVALAANDPLFGKQGFGLVESWQKAGGQVELHFYAAGDHGFGVQHKGTTSDLWLDQFLAWLRANHF